MILRFIIIRLHEIRIVEIEAEYVPSFFYFLIGSSSWFFCIPRNFSFKNAVPLGKTKHTRMSPPLTLYEASRISMNYPPPNTICDSCPLINHE